MTKKMILYLALNFSMLHAQYGAEPPRELWQDIAQIMLFEKKILYEQGWRYIGVIGIDEDNIKRAYVALQYIGESQTFQWTPFKNVPVNQRSETFQIYRAADYKVIFLQYNSDIGVNSAIAYHVDIDRNTAMAVLYRVDPISLQPWQRTAEEDNGESWSQGEADYSMGDVSELKVNE